MPDVTTGQQLNSYQGNPALADGPGKTGYAKVDLSPLETFAINKYKTNLIDYEQQQKDKKDLEEKFLDPNINIPVDKELADQIQPKMARFIELSKENLQDDPKGEKYYEFQNLYKELLQLNAKAKVVQTKKEEYQKAIEQTQDEHEKERLNAHLETLKNYKIGDDVPIYNKYFAFDDAHLPSGEISKGTMKRVRPGKGNENFIDDVEYTINNPLNLDKVAKDQRVRNPKVYTTGQDIGHTLITHGGVPELNMAARDIYNKGLRYNISTLQDKYKAEWEKYQKENSPVKTFRDFMNETGKSNELQSVYDGLKYLVGEDGKAAVRYIPARPGEKLENYTYSDDGKMRLNVDNDTLRAIYGATKAPPGVGETEKVIKSEISKIPSEIALNEQKRAESRAKIGAIKALTAQRQSAAKLNNKKADAIDKQYNPAQTFDEIFKGKTSLEETPSGNSITRINRAYMSKEFLDNLGIDPVNQNGDFNLVPTNVKYNGKSLTSTEVNDIYKGWLKTPAATKLQTSIGKKPDIFDFMYANGATFDKPEIEGRIKPIYKLVKQNDGSMLNTLMNPEEAGKFVRSNALQSWTNQRKGLAVKGDKLLMEESDAEGSVDQNDISE